VGEEYLPHAIPWTVISMARYSPVQDLSGIVPKLKSTSEARRAKDHRFAAQHEVIERIKNHQAMSEISLNLKDRIALAQEEKILDKAQDEALGDTDAEGEGAAAKALEKDLVLRESAKILTDLMRVWKVKELKNEDPVLENAWSWK